MLQPVMQKNIFVKKKKKKNVATYCCSGYSKPLMILLRRTNHEIQSYRDPSVAKLRQRAAWQRGSLGMKLADSCEGSNSDHFKSGSSIVANDLLRGATAEFLRIVPAARSGAPAAYSPAPCVPARVLLACEPRARRCCTHPGSSSRSRPPSGWMSHARSRSLPDAGRCRAAGSFDQALAGELDVHLSQRLGAQLVCQGHLRPQDLGSRQGAGGLEAGSAAGSTLLWESWRKFWSAWIAVS